MTSQLSQLLLMCFESVLKRLVYTCLGLLKSCDYNKVNRIKNALIKVNLTIITTTLLLRRSKTLTIF